MFVFNCLFISESVVKSFAVVILNVLPVTKRSSYDTSTTSSLSNFIFNLLSSLVDSSLFSSVLFVSLTNYIFSHKSYNEFLYIISYSDLLKYLSLILVFIIVVFFICEIITINIGKIAKIC